ncbi:MAG: 30S ribosomal protein S18 [Candidatus Magasanikbacteria bacterium CG10_big_fil_rev_8_21_14_0_10_36_32]|uniref:Small ribosomal subunit protein bS18 n=1 Tax=Candidatus Magasanikbacteria bacterium CG10_big_fil_rev_8_21_14_0_10_36_32 TaxID=1974646 RepID=A0A2M6W707_9BACT|nr:MAG: 30S ribosomal protein S18 [Candidatus Magasanikbacteria bacterium CG10_big_fil_rev_8_21_14_0_10_36_32]
MLNKTKNTKAKGCHYCINNKVAVDYKDINSLRRFVSSYMKIAPRRRSGLCAKHQRQVSSAIKRARQAALMPFIPK